MNQFAGRMSAGMQNLNEWHFLFTAFFIETGIEKAAVLKSMF